MSIYSFKTYEWRYFTARGSCDHLKMLSVLCVYPCVFHLSTLMLVCIPVLGMPDFQLFVPSFLTIQEIINLSALWLYSHVDLIGKHSSYVISSYLSIRHLQSLHNRCYFGKYIPVGIPRIFDPRPKPLMTGPPIYHGSIGSAPPIPGIQQYKSMLL